MKVRAGAVLFAAVIIAAGIVACSSGGTAGIPAQVEGATARRLSSTPIRHVIIVIQENRSFDDLFATFPGANGATTGLAEPMPPTIATYCRQNHQPVITKPTSVPLTEVSSLLGKGFRKNFDWDQDLSHDYRHGYLGDCDAGGKGTKSHPSASNPCAMNGFDLSFSGADGSGSNDNPHPTCTYTYQYVDPKSIQPYWDMAKQYVLADNVFQTQGSLSFTAHQALIAGGTALNDHESVIDDPTYWPWGCDAPPGVTTYLLTTSGEYHDKGPRPCFSYATIRDRLDAKAISWKFYAVKVEGGNAGIWSAFDAIKAVRHDKQQWGTNVNWPDTNIFRDIAKGTLPAVSWITPDGLNSDHPAEATKNHVAEDHGPSWVASIVNAVGESRYWQSSAIVVLWDDWGGFFDHVPPPSYDVQGGMGFRIPLIIISPYVRAHVEHTQYETASILTFIEKNWALKPMGVPDSRATSIGTAFDFNQKPRTFQKIPSVYSKAYFLHQRPSGLSPDTE